MKQTLFLFLLLFFSNNVAAQDIIGCPRSDFGKVVLSAKQSYSGKLEGSIGNYNNEPISLYNPRSIFARLGRPVGRLDILTNIRVFPCTGFLISDKYLITNYHCVPGILENDEVREKGATRIDGVQIVLGYIREGIEEDAKRFTVSPTPIEKSKTLDYAILEVFGHPSEQFGTVKIANADPYDNQPYLIIGHPLGSSQRISREKCLSASPAISGGQVRHKCDTLPGNSGSPVFDQDTRAAIALHHAGSSRNSINYAIPFSRIVKQSPILQKLLAQKTAKKEPKVTMLEEPPVDVPSEPAQSCKDIEVVVQREKRWLKPKDVFRDCATCPQMVVVPEGSFTMGSPKDEKGRDDDEGPQHEVTIAKPFAVGKFEVTVAQFEAFMKSSGYKVGSKCYHWTGKEYKEKPGSYRSPGFKQSGNHPAACINWKDATAYAAWLSKTTGKSYRLLSEAEWEYAARAGKQTRFSFGDKEKELCGYGNHADKSTSFSWKNKTCSDGVGEQTAKVGSFKANTFGLYDMHGNLWEWTRDCLNKTYNGAPEDGSAWTAGDCDRRVLRGGAWYDNPWNLRSANRNWNTTANRVIVKGFRISRTLNP